VDGSYGASITCRTNEAWEKPQVIETSLDGINALIMDGITEGQRCQILGIA
jgi:hypothetical protein